MNNLEFKASRKQIQALKYLMDNTTTEIGYGGSAGGGKSFLWVFRVWMMAKESAEFAENTLNKWAERMKGLAQKAETQGLTMSEINEVKRFYEQNNKFTYGKDITAGEKSVRATNIDNNVREWQIDLAEENGFTNLREMNKETQASKFLLDKLVKNTDWSFGNNFFTLTDYITAVWLGSIDVTMLTWLIGKKALTSNWFRANYAKIINKINGHQTIAEKIADIEKIKNIQSQKALEKFLKNDNTKKNQILDSNFNQDDLGNNYNHLMSNGISDWQTIWQKGSQIEGSLWKINEGLSRWVWLRWNIERSEGKGLDKLREWAETKYQQLAGEGKYWVANSSEKDISAQRATQIQNIRNGKSVEQIAKDYGVDIKIVDKITTPEGLRAYGKYSDGIITLAEKIKEGTAPHELFHATFDLVDSSRKENILRQIEKSKGLDSLNAEEYLADSFSEYFRTGKFDTKTFGKGLVEKIKQYFYQVKQFITGANKNKAQLKKLFDEILDGEIDRDMLGEVLENKKDGLPLNQLQDAKGSIGKPSSPPTTSLAGALEGNSIKSITISPENANFYKNNLKQLWGKSHQHSPEIFLRDLKNSFGVEGNSSYIANNLSDWTHTLRISNHSANARNNKLRGHPENNASIVIKLAESRFRADKSVDLVEFVYNPENLTPEKMQGIIKGVQDWIDTGEYTDKGYDHTHKSIRATLENGEVKYQRVYHGSPYEFDKFDSAHMGKGEGAQAHWWGHYVAVDKKTGERYARTLPMPKYQGKSKWQIPQWWVENSIISNILQRLNDFASIKDAIEKEKMLWNWYEKNERIERGIKFLDGIKESDFEYQNKNLYEVEIPDPVKSNTPTWSNYLEKEWSIKKDALNKIYDELYKYHRDNEKLATFKKRMDNWNIVDWETLQDSLSFVFQDDKAVSKFLESLWYDGIHYHWGIDWESYVIFDDNKLEIKNRSKL